MKNELDKGKEVVYLQDEIKDFKKFCEEYKENPIIVNDKYVVNLDVFDGEDSVKKLISELDIVCASCNSFLHKDNYESFFYTLPEQKGQALQIHIVCNVFGKCCGWDQFRKGR